MSIIEIGLIVAFGFIVAEIAKNKGYVRVSGEPKEKGSKKQTYIAWWFCGALLFIVSIIYVLVLPNLNNETNEQVSRRSLTDSGNNDADELMKYKQLLDAGAITQEEYEIKKRQILGL